MAQNALDALAAQYQSDHPEVPSNEAEVKKSLSAITKDAMALPSIPMKRSANTAKGNPVMAPMPTPDQMTGRSSQRYNASISADPYGRKQGLGGFKPAIPFSETSAQLSGQSYPKEAQMSPDTMMTGLGMGMGAMVGAGPKPEAPNYSISDPPNSTGQPVPTTTGMKTLTMRGQDVTFPDPQGGQHPLDWNSKSPTPFGVRATNTIMEKTPDTFDPEAAGQRLQKNLEQERAATKANTPLSARVGRSLTDELEWFASRYPTLTSLAKQGAKGAALGTGATAATGALYGLYKFLQGKEAEWKGGKP